MDDRKDMVYLEFMKGGGLSGLIGKTVAMGTVFRNTILWNVFFCRKFRAFLATNENSLTICS